MSTRAGNQVMFISNLAPQQSKVSYTRIFIRIKRNRDTQKVLTASLAKYFSVYVCNVTCNVRFIHSYYYS